MALKEKTNYTGGETLVKIRVLDPEAGDQLLDLTPVEAADLVWDQKEKGITKFGLWEGADAQLELEMMTRTGILDALKERSEDILRLVPIVGGG